MSEAVDDILRELAGISFSEEEETRPEQSAPDDLYEQPAPKAESFAVKAGETRTPSVTDTLTAVFAMIEESSEDAELSDAPETPPVPAPAVPEKRRKEKSRKNKPPEKPAKTKRPRRERDAVPMEQPPEKPSGKRAERPAGTPSGDFTRVVRIPLRELTDDTAPEVRSRREQLFDGDKRGPATRRFAPQPGSVPRQETLQGGARLQKVTRRASSAEQVKDRSFPEMKKATVRIDAGTRETPADEQTIYESMKPADGAPEQSLSTAPTADEILAGLMAEQPEPPVQADGQTRPLQIDVEEIRAAEPDPAPLPADEPEEETDDATRAIDASGQTEADEEELQSALQSEGEPAPELSRAELRRLKKQQQEGLEKQRRRKREENAAENEAAEDTVYQPGAEETGETASGFAPCFKKLSWLNSAAEISSWRKALRDLAGPSMGLGVLLLFLGAAVLALSMLVEMTDLVNGGIFLWVCAGLGLLGGVAGWKVLVSGIKSLFRFQENRDIMPAVLYLMTMVQTVVLALHPDMMAKPEVHCYLSVGLLVMACSCFNRWLTASNALRNLRFLHSGGSKYYLHMVRDGRLATEMTRGVVEGPAFVAVNRRTESVSDFMKLSLSADESDRMSRNLAGIGLMASLLALGFSLLFTWDLAMGLTLMTAVCCLFSPVMALFLLCYPMRRTARFMERSGGVVISEKALTRYSLVNAAVLDAKDIFPQGFVTLNGMKTFGDARVDDVIIQAASMVIGSGSILTGIFEGIMGKERTLLRQVDDRTYEDGKGLTGFIGGQQVFLGNRAFLESRGIRFSLDEHQKWASGVGCACVYLAVARELCAVFMIRLHTSVRSEEAVQIFADNGISLSVRTVDSFLTPRLLGRLFRVNPDRIKILPSRLSPYVDRLCSEVRVKQAVAVNDGTISGFAGCAACARRLSFMQGLNQVLMVLSIVLGLLMLLMLTLLGSLSSVSPLVMAGYACFWPVLGWILQKLIRI